MSGYSLPVRSDTKSSSAQTSSSLALSWRVLFIATLCVTVALIATLSVVAIKVGADALSTIALVLAILAFIIQIIVFIAQSWTSGQQMLQSEQINSDTRSLLAELQESARGTNRLLAQQFDRVLERLLNTTEREVSKALPQGEVRSFRGRLERSLREDLAHLGDVDFSEYMRPAQEDDAEREEYLTTYPSEEEARADASLVSGLKLQEQLDLTEFARDEVACLHGKGIPGKWANELKVPEALLKKGLIREASKPKLLPFKQETFYELTDEGRRVARWWSGRGPRPTYLAEFNGARATGAVSGPGD